MCACCGKSLPIFPPLIYLYDVDCVKAVCEPCADVDSDQPALFSATKRE